MNRRKPLNQRYLIKAATLAIAGLILLSVIGCGSDNGAKPSGCGSGSNTIPLPSAGARRMEISPNSAWGVLLYDSLAIWPRDVMIVRINLATGTTDQLEFPGLTDAFDILFTSNDEVVFSFLSAAGYGLRFVNLATMTADGADIIYESNREGFGGRLALDASREHLFVTHTGFQITQRGPVFPGKVLAYSVAQRTAVDADSSSNDGNTAFDTSLVRGSLAWPDNIAFDDARQEILIGNRNASFVTAIDWKLWGKFDRNAGLVAPVPGVRMIAMNLQAPLFQPWFLDFADGVGVAANPQYSQMVSYQSGADAGNLLYAETASSLRSEDHFHFLTIVPSRQSWFALFLSSTPSDPDKRQTGVEERSLSTLRRVNRYESKLFVLPDRGQPRAFAVDTARKQLYVGYRNRAILEIFCMP